MKKLCLLITAICLLSLNSIDAQIEQGKFMTGVSSTIGIGGSWGSELVSMGFLKSKYGDETYKETRFNLMPRIGYMVIENLALGLDVIVNTYSEKSSDSDYKHSNSIIGAGPFIRYYYPLDKIYPFAEAGILLGSSVGKYQSGSYDSEEKTGVTLIGFGAGASKPIGMNAMLDLMAGYSRVAWKDKDPDPETTGESVCSGIIIKGGFTITFGLQ